MHADAIASGAVVPMPSVGTVLGLCSSSVPGAARSLLCEAALVRHRALVSCCVSFPSPLFSTFCLTPQILRGVRVFFTGFFLGWGNQDMYRWAEPLGRTPYVIVKDGTILYFPRHYADMYPFASPPHFFPSDLFFGGGFPPLPGFCRSCSVGLCCAGLYFCFKRVHRTSRTRTNKILSFSHLFWSRLDCQ